MAAILNLSFDDIEKICTQSAQKTGGVCEIANDNSAGQVVISGHKNAIDMACVLAKEAGAKRALILPVSASFHCSLMQPAADIMKDAFENVTIYDAKVPVINNVNVTEITKISDIKTALISQITGRVRWRETMDYAQNHQITHIAEIGAGKVLTGLFKRACPDIISYNLLSISEIENYAQSFIKSAA
jgi:[acyl-carrier-protein] S-malonyltransferase